MIPVTPQKLHAIEERRTKVSDLYRKKYRQHEIAKILGVSQTTICHDIQALHAEWKESRIDNVEQAKMQALAQIRWMQPELMERWEEITTPHQGSRFMEEMRHLIELEAKIVGYMADPKLRIEAELVTMTKEQKDATIDAAMQSMVFKVKPLQPPFKQIPQDTSNAATPASR